uniref:Amiloride-sensitive sodium channel n=1 Tax=Bursaphelenchus xylophilus TaxID=6326 RepID=A0A1I7RP83_BURXY
MPQRADRMVGHMMGGRGPGSNRNSVLILRHPNSSRPGSLQSFRTPRLRESRPQSRVSAGNPPTYAEAEDIPSIDGDDFDEARSAKYSVVDKDGEVVGEVVVGNGMIEMLKDSDIEGVRHLSDDRFSARLLWGIVIVVFLCLAIYQIATQVRLFLKTPISTNIEAHYPAEVPFPVIAICNNNQYRLTYLTGKRLLNRPRKFKGDSKNSTDIYDEALQAAWDYDAIKFLRNAAHWKSRMIMDCHWPNGTRCVNQFKAMWTLTGLCWAINTDPMNPITVSGAGPSHGLRLLLNIERYERIESCTPKFKATGLPGLKILIFNQNHSAISGNDGVNVPPGYSMDIPFRVQERHKFPGKTCIQETEEQKSTTYTSFDDPNNLRTCVIRRFLQDVEYKCNCSLKRAYDPTGSESLPACNVQEYFNCVDPIKKQGMNMGFNQYNCETPCDEIDYIAWQDMNELPMNIFPKIIDTESNDSSEEEDDDDVEVEDEDTYPAEILESIKCEENQLLDEKQVADVKLYAHRAYEKQARYQEDILIRTKRLIGRVNQTANRLIELQWGWNDDDFVGVYERLHKYVPCFANMTDRHADVFAAIRSPASHSEEHRSKLLYQLVNPTGYKANSEKFKTLADVKREYGEKAEIRLDEMTKWEGVLERLASIYDEQNYNHKLSEKLKRMNRIITLMDNFDKGLLQKRAWADKMKNRNMDHFFDEDFYENWYNVIIKDMEVNILKTVSNIEHALPDAMSFIARGKGLDTGSVILFGDTSNEHVRMFANFMDDALSCTFDEVRNQSAIILEEFRKAMHDFQSAYINLFKKELPEYLEKFEFGHKFVKENFAEVNVFLHKMNVEIWRQDSTYSIWSLFCDVGGALGLFLGASLLTIIEFFYLCFQYGFCKTENLKPQKLDKEESLQLSDKPTNEKAEAL